MVSESSGLNESERTTGLETVDLRGRAFLHEAKSASPDVGIGPTSPHDFDKKF
jgi:hypothetical protein